MKEYAMAAELTPKEGLIRLFGVCYITIRYWFMTDVENLKTLRTTCNIERKDKLRQPG